MIEAFLDADPHKRVRPTDLTFSFRFVNCVV